MPGCEVAVYGGYTGQHASTLVLTTDGAVAVAITRADFPLPDVDDQLTAEYFAGAARGELVIPRCDRCGAWVWYPEADVPDVRRRRSTWTATTGRGRLFSWVVVERPFLPAFADMVPFVTALVALEEDPAVRIVTYSSTSTRPRCADLPMEVDVPAAGVPDGPGPRPSSSRCSPRSTDAPARPGLG